MSVEIGGILAEPCNTLMICSGFDSLWRQKYWVLCYSITSRCKVSVHSYNKILRISVGSDGLCSVWSEWSKRLELTVAKMKNTGLNIRHVFTSRCEKKRERQQSNTSRGLPGCSWGCSNISLGIYEKVVKYEELQL